MLPLFSPNVSGSVCEFHRRPLGNGLDQAVIRAVLEEEKVIKMRRMAIARERKHGAWNIEGLL